MRKLMIMSSLLLAATAALPAQAPANATESLNIDTYVDLLRQDVKSQKVAIIGQLMNFTPDQAAAFWPIYSEYSKEIAKLGDEKYALIKDYAANYVSMTAAKADQLAKATLDLEGRRVDVKKKFHAKASTAVGGVLAARVIQVENQLQFILDLQISASLPVIE